MLMLGCFLLQRGDANPSWLGLICVIDRWVQFWCKSKQRFYSSFPLLSPSKGVIIVWVVITVAWCCCSCSMGSAHALPGPTAPRILVCWVLHKDERVMGKWGSSQWSSSFPAQKYSPFVHKRLFNMFILTAVSRDSTLAETPSNPLHSSFFRWVAHIFGKGLSFCQRERQRLCV